jgi:hypothetical protein
MASPLPSRSSPSFSERTNNEATAGGSGGVHAQLHDRTDEIAELAAYIAGPHGAMMTGAMHTIDSGISA